jgi:putative MFS transporter
MVPLDRPSPAAKDHDMEADKRTGSSDVAGRLDRLPVTALHVAATALCAAGFMFDLMEITFGSVLSAVFSSPPHAVPAAQLSILLSSVYVGAVIGAPAMGWWADRHGRRNTLMGLLIWLSLMSVAAAFSTDVVSLTWLRGLAGLALGAYPPLVIAYLTDILPPRRRGLLILLTVGIASLGPVAGVFFIRSLASAQWLGLDAWRWGFLLGGSGAAVCGLLFRALPESPRWLLAKGRDAEAQAACSNFEQSRVVGVFREHAPAAASPAPARGGAETARIPSLARTRALVGGLFLLSPWSTVAFPLLTGAILTQRGFKLSDALLYVGMSNFGSLAGALLAATVIDRIDRKLALAACAVVMMVSGAGFLASDAPGWLMLTSIGFSLAGFLYVSTINLYGAELFPTETRAASISGSWALNRLGAAVAPLLLLPLLHSGGPSAMFVVIAGTLAATLFLLRVAPPGRQLRPVS